MSSSRYAKSVIYDCLPGLLRDCVTSTMHGLFCFLLLQAYWISDPQSLLNSGIIPTSIPRLALITTNPCRKTCGADSRCLLLNLALLFYSDAVFRFKSSGLPSGLRLFPYFQGVINSHHPSERLDFAFVELKPRQAIAHRTTVLRRH